MAIQVQVELTDLSEEGVFEAAKVLLQGDDLAAADWPLTGRLIENHQMSLRYLKPIGAPGLDDMIWSAAIEDTLIGEHGRTPHHAVARCIVARAMVDERLPLPIKSALRWVEERYIFVDAIETESDHHRVVDHGGNRSTASAKAGAENLEHFQNVVLLIEALEGEYLQESRRATDPASGLVSEVEYTLL